MMKSLGCDNNLLYWEPILAGLYGYEKDIVVFTRDTSAVVKDAGLVVSKVFDKNKFKTFTKIPRLVNIVRRKANPVIIASEFNEITLAAVLVKTIVRRAKIILLIENHPRYLLKYKTKASGKVASYFNLVYRRIVASLADVVVANTVHAQEYALSDLSLPRERVLHKLYLTSSMGEVGPRLYCSDDLPITFVSVGRMDQWKGFDLLIAAIALMDDASRAQCRFVLIGDGKKRCDLEASVREKGLDNYVDIIGYVPFCEIREWYLRADVAVIVTRADYRSLVGFEALSCGLAIIASIYDGATDEIVVDGENGFVVDPYDVENLARRISWYVQNKDQIPKFGKRSFHRAKSYMPAIAASNLYAAIKAV